MHLLARTAPLDSAVAVAVAPDAYVQLDGVDYEDFGVAFDDAVDGSVIEFCGEWDGPFTRREGLSELTIAGCDMGWAVLDGQNAGTVLRMDVERLWLSDLAMTSGVASSEEVPCDGGTYEDTGKDCYTNRGAFIERATLALDAWRVAFTDASVGDGLPIAVGVGTDTDFSGSSMRFVDGVAHRNFGDAADEGRDPVWGFMLWGPATFLGMDWGTGDDENAGYDINAAAYGTDVVYDLSGVADALCSYGKGCILEEH